MSSTFSDPREPAHVPEPVALVARLMSTFPGWWALCGGWAVDAWLGRITRDHGDIDFAIFQDEQGALFEHLAGWRLIGHDDNVADDSQEPWDGRWLDVPAHIHARHDDGSDLDIQVNLGSPGEWVFRDEPRIRIPGAAIRPSGWGVPTAAPEVLLLYKAHPPVWRDTARVATRRRDERDFEALLPALDEGQRSWLRDAVTLVAPGHPWLERLS